MRQALRNSAKRAPALGYRPSRTFAHGNSAFLDNVQITLIAGYIAFSGIYWLPGISHILISNIKLLLFVFLVGLGILRFKIFIAEQKSIYFWLGVGAICAFSASYATTDMKTAIDQARNYVEPLLWLIALFGIRSSALPLFFSRIKAALTVFFLISLYPVGIYVGIFPNFYAPDALTDPTGLHLDKEWVLEAASILGGGFNGGSTGWGVTVSTTALLLVALYLNKTRRANFNLIVAAIIVAGSIMSIYVTGARGGTAALIMVTAYSILVARGHRVSRVFLVLGSMLILIYVDLASLLSERFLRNFDATGDFFTRLNAVTTGRVESYLGALAHFSDAPLVGKGPYDARVLVRGIQEISVHNLWLRQLAESGLFVFLPVLFLTLHLTWLAFADGKSSTKALNGREATWPNAGPVILCGLVMALVEPSVVIGAFNANVVIWTAVWLQLRKLHWSNLNAARTI